MSTVDAPPAAPDTLVATPRDGVHSHPKRPHLTIRARRGWIAMDMKELWRFRDLLLSLTARDIKLRYKQTALGVIWVILQPLVAAGIFSFVFGKLANLPGDHTVRGQAVPLFLFTFTGLVAWNLFYGIINKVSIVLVGNASLVSKVYFPRVMLPLAGATGMLVDLLVVMGLLVIMQGIGGVPFTARWLAVPGVLMLVLGLSLGIGMWAAALCVQYRDVGYILPVFLQFLLFASAVLYPVSAADKLGDWALLFYLNPLVSLMGAWRWAVLATPFPPMGWFVYSCTVSVLVMFLGVMIFRRMERTFADVI